MIKLPAKYYYYYIKTGWCTLVAQAFKHAGARVNSLGEILADRTVMNKYLNPNIVTLATMSPPTRQVPEFEHCHACDHVTADQAST